MKNIRSKWFFVTMTLLITVACSTVPLTGRKQLNLIPESELMSLSLTQYNDFLSKNKISNDAASTAMVKRVGTRIAGAVEKYMASEGLSDYIKDYKWEFNLIEDKTVNAWCMPGGKVVVYTGILPVAQNDEGLATVMGHEIAHAIARHGNERMSDQLVLQLGGATLQAALASKPQETQQLAAAAFGIGSQVGIMLPFSRKHEYEADEMGLIFMAMAGYNPNASISFWERMAKQGGAGMPEFLSTHPLSQNRVAKLQRKLPEAMKYYRK